MSAVDAFIKKHGLAKDEVWEVRPRTYAIKHAALERLAGENKITFDPPLMLEFHAADKIAALCVTGNMGDRKEWSIGEAAPYNNKNGYPFAMAEKRAKDRVILKLLNGSEAGFYSDSEADDFAEGKQYATLPKKDAKEIYTKMQAEVRDSQSREQLKTWMDGNKDRIKVLPEDWQDILRLQCEEMMADLRNREAA